MSKLGDRLGSKLGPNARSILEAGREGDNPTAADRARVKRALMRTLAAGAVVGATSSAASSAGAAAAPLVAKGTSIALGIKLFGAVVLVLAAAGGVVLQRASSPDQVVAPAPAPSASAVAAMDTENAAPATVGSAIAAPTGILLGEPDSPLRANDAVRGEKPRPASSQRIAATAPVALDEAEAAPLAPAAAPKPAATAEDPLAAETRRLREAHAALQAGDATKALDLLNVQGGQLEEEPAAERVLVFCKLENFSAFEAARDAFLRRYPRSPLAGRVRAPCEIKFNER